jgi:hypothetical protein
MAASFSGITTTGAAFSGSKQWHEIPVAAGFTGATWAKPGDGWRISFYTVRCADFGYVHAARCRRQADVAGVQDRALPIS